MKWFVIWTYHCTVIAMLDVSTRSWSQVGTLTQGRDGHAVTVRQTDFIITGGFGTTITERCEYANGEMNCVIIEPVLADFYVYPETMLVNEDYCITVLI